MSYLITTVNGNRNGCLLVALVEQAAFPGNIAGVTILHNFNSSEGRAELGYWIRPSCRSMGIATGAAKLMVAIGFDSLGLERIDSLIPRGNQSSIRVAEKLGFSRVAIGHNTGKSAYRRYTLRES